MKPQIINQEILLFTGTSLSKRQFCEKNDTGNETTGSSSEQLQKACWAGLLFEMLPELMDNSIPRKENYIWEILPAEKFIRVILGFSTGKVETETSIDPYFFLAALRHN